jgi:hypothetical protein
MPSDFSNPPEIIKQLLGIHCFVIAKASRIKDMVFEL